MEETQQSISPPATQPAMAEETPMSAIEETPMSAIEETPMSAIAPSPAPQPAPGKGLQVKGVFKLSYGHVHYEPSSSKSGSAVAAAAPEEVLEEVAVEALAPAAAANPAKGKSGRLPPFNISGKNGAPAIGLYHNQMMRLIEALPEAYEAYKASDGTYRYEVVKNSDKLITLEVSLYEGKPYLFLKRYFNLAQVKQDSVSSPIPMQLEVEGGGGQEGSGEAEKKPTWIPTRSVVSLNPNHDHPADLMHFVLGCYH